MPQITDWSLSGNVLFLFRVYELLFSVYSHLKTGLRHEHDLDHDTLKTDIQTVIVLQNKILLKLNPTFKIHFSIAIGICFFNHFLNFLICDILPNWLQSHLQFKPVYISVVVLVEKLDIVMWRKKPDNSKTYFEDLLELFLHFVPVDHGVQKLLEIDKPVIWKKTIINAFEILIIVKLD